jgi:hypothetical protein
LFLSLLQGYHEDTGCCAGGRNCPAQCL